ILLLYFFFQAEDGIRDRNVTGVQTCALPIFGGMISIELGSVERARRFVERTRLFALAESLGGVESLVGHPATMTHASVPPEMRRSEERRVGKEWRSRWTTDT